MLEAVEKTEEINSSGLAAANEIVGSLLRSQEAVVISLASLSNKVLIVSTECRMRLARVSFNLLLEN
ncbi:unnamed protein product [Leptosia nina]|uniref:Uncharacterized protein n=1 Tax=Leptosia nina TaxID=320188 RepID=A0AAV1JQU2_9NEOP